jgi:hypothetical protein
MQDGARHWSSRLPFYYGWVIIGIAFVTMAIGVTARTAFSLLMPPLIDEFGWERALAAGAFSFGFVEPGRRMGRGYPRPSHRDLDRRSAVGRRPSACDFHGATMTPLVAAAITATRHSPTAGIGPTCERGDDKSALPAAGGQHQD